MQLTELQVFSAVGPAGVQTEGLTEAPTLAKLLAALFFPIIVHRRSNEDACCVYIVQTDTIYSLIPMSGAGRGHCLEESL